MAVVAVKTDKEYNLDGDIMSNEKNSIGTPFSSCMKLHDEIGNKKEDHLLISDSLFENAEDYFSASQIIIKHDSNLFSVAYVNVAFSCELYLKSIIFQFKNDNTRIKEHKLYELYKMLPPDLQVEIETNCTFQFELKDRFELFFQEVSEAFVFTRYIHERKSSCLSLDLFNLALAVRNCAKNFYNARIVERNKTALGKLEERLKTDIEPFLKFWIYYAVSEKCNIEVVAQSLVEKLCDSLKSDFGNYELGEKNDEWNRGPAIILNFSRQGFIYSMEYNNIVEVSLRVFKNFGMSNKGIRNNGYRVELRNLVD